MKISIKRFDLQDVSIAPDSVLTFPAGLVGLEENRRFCLMHEEGSPTVFWLQSLDDEALTLNVVSPDSLDMAYSINLSDEECRQIDLQDPADAVVLLVVFREEGAGEGAGGLGVSARSPLVVNAKSRLGLQKVLSDVQPTLVLRGS